MQSLPSITPGEAVSRDPIWGVDYSLCERLLALRGVWLHIRHLRCKTCCMTEATERDERPSERDLAVTREVAARVARLSLRQVDYWAGRGDIVAPSIDARVSPGRRVRLYSFVDLLALSTAAELRNRGVSPQHIRAIVRHLKSRGYRQPLTELRYATLPGKAKGKVYFQHPDGSWENDLRPDQTVVYEVLNLQPLRDRIVAEVGRRDESLAGKFERRRGSMGSKPVLAGTRVPVDTVRRYLESGRSVADVLRAFPLLTEADVEAVRQAANA